MGIFGRLFGTKETDSARFDKVEAKVRDLVERSENLERAFKGIELDWEESYDKLKHLMARITKRQKAQNDEEAAPEALGPMNGRPEGGSAPPAIGSHQALSAMRSRLFGRG